MAEVIFRALLERRGYPEDWKVASAGTWALPGRSATHEAREAVRSMGLSLEDHRGTEITRELLEQHDLVLVMENGQREALRLEFGNAADRVHLLSTMVSEEHDIPDPSGKGLDACREVAGELEQVLTSGFETIVALARNPQTSADGGLAS
jgi:protein-tyrosine phosphatase